MTFIPFEKALIDECLLTNEHVKKPVVLFFQIIYDVIEIFFRLLLKVDWLNKYYEEIRIKVGSRLVNYTTDIQKYLTDNTEPFKYARDQEKCLIK